MENQTTPAMHDHAQDHAAIGPMKKCWHWGCCILPIVGTILWIAAIVFVAAAWMSVFRNDLVWGYGAQWWIWNALMFGILALFGKAKGHGACGCGNGRCM